jgi:hypothetical protein
MLKLNLPEYNFKFIKEKNKLKIFDNVRKLFVTLTPEEWVRQNYIMFLINEKDVPASHIITESQLKLHELKKRTDAIIYNKKMEASVLIEFKSPEVKIETGVFEQINRYNIALKLKYLIVTNGLTHYYCRVNNENNNVEFLNDIPMYNEL